MSPAVDLMIAGVPKSGTTSLKNYLGQHPGVCTHAQREMTFFASDTGYDRGFEAVLPLFFPCAVGCADRVLIAKSVAMMYSPEAMARLREHNPRVQVVLALRNPVARAYSEYWYARRRGWESLPSFEAAIRADASRFGGDHARAFRCAYLERSRYFPHVSAMLDIIPREQLHVVLVEELKRDAAAVCQSLFRLLPGLDPSFRPRAEQRDNTAALPRSEALLRLTSSGRALPRLRAILRRAVPERGRQRLRDLVQRANEREFVPPPLKPATRAELTAYFAPFNRKLEELLGLDLSVWDGPLPLDAAGRLAAASEASTSARSVRYGS